jgi:CDP-diacylglycerol--serine O-phosphatidyltransferase
LNHLTSTTTVRLLIVNSFTSLNLMLGLLALFATIAGVTSVAAWCLLACVVIDACDGSLARHWHVTSAFGAQLDSLADMTSFSIASGVLAYYWLQPKVPFVLVAGASCLYILSGAIRLARFTATQASEYSPYFQGMPTTTVAAVVATTYLAVPQINSLWGLALVVVLALLMVSVFPYPRLSELRRCPPWLWLIVLCGILINPPWAFWLLSLSYIAVGPLIWLYRRYTAR